MGNLHAFCVCSINVTKKCDIEFPLFHTSVRVFATVRRLLHASRNVHNYRRNADLRLTVKVLVTIKQADLGNIDNPRYGRLGAEK